MLSARRARFREGLNPIYATFYDELSRMLPERWAPFYGLRTLEQQKTLYAQGRDTPGAAVTNAKAGESAHNYGCASDWTVFVAGKPTWPDSQDPIWREYQTACSKLGLAWGGDFRIRDCFHNELVIGVSWK